MFAALKVVALLDRDHPRSLDYILAVNTITAFILLRLGKPGEAAEFAQIAEKVLSMLVDCVAGAEPTP